MTKVMQIKEKKIEKYFVIYCSEDGDISIDQFNEEELVEKLDDSYWGKIKFMKEIKETDPQYWDNELLVIKGKIIKKLNEVI